MVHGVKDAEYIVYTDNQATYQKWHGMMFVKRFTEQLWEDIYNTKLLLEIKNVKLDLRKVKSHATAEEMARGLSSPVLKYGNDRADHWAGEQVQGHEAGSGNTPGDASGA